MTLSHLLLSRLKSSKPLSIYILSRIPKPVDFSSLSAAPDSAHQSSPTPKPTSLSARMSFLFEQMDEIDKNREEKDQTLQRIRTWRESKKHKDSPSSDPAPDPSVGDSMDGLKLELEKSEAFLGSNDMKKEVELVHPWPEWIELMERLVQQNYFDQRRKDEDRMMEGLGFDVSEEKAQEDKRLDFARDFRTVEAAVVNFGRDRFDILRSLSRHDLQILVGYGCSSADKKVVYSSKLLRKHVHLDEGDVCSSCSLRGCCEKAYLLTNKEDEARTIDVMRILLDYGFDPIDGSAANKSVLKNKAVKTVVRKLLHEVIKLSAVPIDPNLPPPVIKRPPPKVKQPPPPKKRVGRNDIEMKKGDWLCQKCDFMNFAKNTVCLQCDAKRPKRQLLPGEWECPQCNFLNYRRNTVCFHCEHQRPPDTYPESQFLEKQRRPLNRMEKTPSRRDVSDAWNFDFDDNESDGADVAAFEYADSRKLDEDFPPSNQTRRENSRGHEDGFERSSRPPKGFEREYPDSSSMRSGVGFNDFDEDDDGGDDVDSYELVGQNEMPKTSRIDFSELEADSESDDVEGTKDNWHARGKTKFPRNSRKQMNRRTVSDSDSEDGEVDFDTDDDLPIHPNWKSSHVANPKQQNRGSNALAFGSDDDLGFSSSSDDDTVMSNNKGYRRGSIGMGRGRDFDDETMRSKSRGNRRGSNGMDRGRGGQSNFKASFSERDSDDDTMRSKSRGNRRGSNVMDRGRGGRSNFKASFSERDSDDDLSYQVNRQRDRAGQNGQIKAFRGGMTDGKKNSRNSDFDRSWGQKSSNRGSQEDSFYGRAKNGRDSNTKFRSHKQGGTFDKRGGRSNNYDDRSESYEVDERHQRPRNNVR